MQGANLTLLLSLAALTSCGGPDALPRDLGLKDVPLAHGAKEPTKEQAELGKLLFFDPRLSASGKTSCSTCHHTDKAWTDGKKFSTKDDGSLNTRNTPSVYNVGYLEKLYWDGRTPNLEANIKAAWKGQMGGKPDDTATTIDGVAGYMPLFQAAFGAAPTGANIVDALAAFLRTLRSGNSPYDDHKVNKNPTALSTDAKLGEELFMGRAGCLACHLPPLFTDRTFHNTGIGLNAEPKDLGAGPVHKEERWEGAFKTPSLRGVALTAPYFHDGSAATLEEAVRTMANGGFENPKRDPALMDRKLKDNEIKQIVAFLESLTGPEPITAPALPK